MTTMEDLEIHNTGAQITLEIRGQFKVQNRIDGRKKQEVHPAENAGHRQPRAERNKAGV